MDKQDLLERLSRYLSRHPEEVLRLIKNALLLRFGVPLAALRWLASQAKGNKAPRDVQIEAVPPGVRIGATIDLMGTLVRASALIYFDRIELDSEKLRFEIRLADVSLRLLEESDSPVATLIQSGALDLSKPGNLVRYMPKRPQFLVEAEDDRVVLDFMKHPKIAKNPALGTILGVVTPVITVSAVESDWEHLDIVCTAFKRGWSGLSGALASVRQAL